MRPRTILLTGAGGFLGKVLLEALVRRRHELHVDRIVAVIRPRGGRRAAERFEEDMVPARCFAGLPADWPRLVTVLEGDLSAPQFGGDDASRAVLATVTHIVHAAAAVSFDLPVTQAAAANVVSTIRLLDLAREMDGLERFTYVSTAYVTPHGPAGPIAEALAPLPAPPAALLALIERDPREAESTMRRGGYPNTYTFTKSLAEHLLLERCAQVPVAIVRPSIITAARLHPTPGWIDSSAGFGAFVSLIGAGALRVVRGDPRARLDLVCVDDVADAVLSESFGPTPHGAIRHATAGAARSATVAECFREICGYFRDHPVAGRPGLAYVGLPGVRSRVAELVLQGVPQRLAQFRTRSKRRAAERAGAKRDHLNRVFPYFTSRTFDFQSRDPIGGPPDAAAFVRTICRGIAEHVWRRDEREWVLAGERQPRRERSMRWVLTRPHGNPLVRMGVWLSMVVLRRITERATVDIPSFARARAAAVPGDAIVLVPSHRSYLDFILVSMLAFARPDLGIGIPHVAAAIEFGRIPVLGRLLRGVHAFYVRRGTGRENRELMQRVHRLLSSGDVLEFFIEGERSRSRAFLTPKRGLLRAVITCGRPATVLPIAISYDRVPEEAAFLHELRGGSRPRMRLGALVRWLWRAMRGDVQLGRIHLECGAPVRVDGGSSVEPLAAQLIAHQRDAMAVSAFHLAVLEAAGESPEVTREIARAVEFDGGRVLQSALAVPTPLDPTFVATIVAHCAPWSRPVAAGPRATPGDDERRVG